MASQKQEMDGAMSFKDLTGAIFSRLTVIDRASNKGKKTRWCCLCICGNRTTVMTSHLTTGHTTSCGCRQQEIGRESGKRNARHGMSNSPTWNTWSGIVYRCTTHSSRQYDVYGGMLCDRWLRFENFLEDMGVRPAGKTLDRIDVEKGYSPDNCRWATPRQQQNNKETTRYLAVDGERVPLMELARLHGIKKSAAQYFFTTAQRLMAIYGYIPVPEQKRGTRCRVGKK
jgi:hypothetical protein